MSRVVRVTRRPAMCMWRVRKNRVGKRANATAVQVHGDGRENLKAPPVQRQKGDEPVEVELEDIVGVAVDSAGTVWVYWEGEGRIDAFSDAKGYMWLPGSEVLGEVEEKLGECTAGGPFGVVGAGEAFYIGYERYNASEECPGQEGGAGSVLVAKVDAHGGLVTREVDRESTSGVAVEPSDGEAFVDNGDGVSAFASSGGLIQTFGTEGEGELVGASGAAVDDVGWRCVCGGAGVGAGGGVRS